MTTNYKRAFVQTLELEPEGTERRIQMQVQAGYPRELAVIIEEAFQQALYAAVEAVGATVDSLSPDVQPEALPYIMRGVASNFDALEDAVVRSLVKAVTEAGGIISVVGGSDNCPCATCVARRNSRQPSSSIH